MVRLRRRITIGAQKYLDRIPLFNRRNLRRHSSVIVVCNGANLDDEKTVGASSTPTDGVKTMKRKLFRSKKSTASIGATDEYVVDSASSPGTSAGEASPVLVLQLRKTQSAAVLGRGTSTTSTASKKSTKRSPIETGNDVTSSGGIKAVVTVEGVTPLT